jgi:hypothetical protein
MNYKRLVASIFTIVMGIIGFSGPQHTAKADQEAVKFTITMDEYHFTVEGQQPNDPIQLKVNQPYAMTLKNTGKLSHEIWWGKDTQMQEGRLDGYSTGLFDGVSVTITGTQASGQDPFEINSNGLTEIALNPGQVLTVEFTLPDKAKGEWEIGCFQPMPKGTPEAKATAEGTAIPDVPHYAVGMKAKLIVS